MNPCQICADKVINLTIHHRVHLTGFLACPVILYQSIGHKDVGTNLAAPADFLYIPTDFRQLLHLLLNLEGKQLTSQHFECLILIGKLASLLLTGYHNPRREVCDTDCR